MTVTVDDLRRVLGGHHPGTAIRPGEETSLPAVAGSAQAYGAVPVLLVGRRDGLVVHANDAARRLTPGLDLPADVERWARHANLSAASWSAGVNVLAELRRGEPTAGPLRTVDARDGGGRPRWWLTAVSGDAFGAGRPTDGRRAPAREPFDGLLIVVLVRLDDAGSTDASAWQDGAIEARERAVAATDISFSITDPLRPGNPLVWVNPAFTRCTGYGFDESVGRNLRFLQGPQTDQGDLDRLGAALRARRPITITLLNYRRDGSTFWNEMSISPVYDPTGGLVNFVGVQTDVTARVLAEAGRERALHRERTLRAQLGLLVRVGDCLADLDGRTGLRRCADALSSNGVRWCVLLEVDDDTLRVAAASGPQTPRLLGHRLPLAGRRSPAAPTVPDDVIDLLAGRRREPVALDAATSGGAPPDGHPTGAGSIAAWLRRSLADTRGVEVWALPGRRGVVGLLVVCPQGRVFDHDEHVLLGEVTRRAGLAMDDTRQVERERAISETLQRSLFSQDLRIPGLDVWTYYAPNEQHSQVGGDWYDVLRCLDDVAGLLVGDVVGHDVEAAATMGQLRSVVRSFAYEVDDPGEVLGRVDHLATGVQLPRLASLVYATLHPNGDGSWQMAWSNAGHLPPLLRRAGTRGRPPRVEQLTGAVDTLIGIGHRKRPTDRLRLEPHDVVVLYTDGLIERRGRPLPEGLAQLARVLQQAEGADAAAIGEHLTAALAAAPEDDVAVVVLRVPPVESATVGRTLAEANLATPSQHTWRFAATASSVGRARRATARTCDAWGLSCSPRAEIVVSELVSNAVLHGEGPVLLRLRKVGGGLHIEVEDASRRAPQQRVPHEDSPGGHGLHVVGAMARWGWAPTGRGKVVWAQLDDVAGLPL